MKNWFDEYSFEIGISLVEEELNIESFNEIMAEVAVEDMTVTDILVFTDAFV